MQSKKIHLAVPTTGDSVGDMGALSSVLFTREELIKQGYLVKVQCFSDYEELIADVAKHKPRFAVIVEGHSGKVDLEVDSNESLDRATDAIAKGAEEYKAFADRQFTFMKDYVVAGDGVEAAIYEDGVTIAGNFSSEDKTYMGRSIPAGDFIVIEQE